MAQLRYPNDERTSIITVCFNDAQTVINDLESGIAARDAESQTLCAQLQRLQFVQDQYTILRRQNDEPTGDLIHLRSQLHPQSDILSFSSSK